MNVRPVPTVVGVTALLGAAAVALDAVPAAIPGRLVLIAVGLLGASLALLALLARSTDGPVTDPLPNPRSGAGVRTPGDEVDRQLATVASDPETESDVRDRVRAAAVATLVRTRGLSRQAARDHLAAGTWTDEERAAAFLADETDRLSIGERVRAAATGESTAQRRARRTIDELASLEDR